MLVLRQGRIAGLGMLERLTLGLPLVVTLLVALYTKRVSTCGIKGPARWGSIVDWRVWIQWELRDLV